MGCDWNRPLRTRTALMSNPPTWLERHLDTWSECSRCPLHLTARTHVLMDLSEGVKPHVLFVGEGPGRSENVIGKPFVGRAGKLLRIGIDGVRPSGVRVAFANLVACRACDSRQGPNREPYHPEIMACSPRLQELVRRLSPRAVCLLGKVPQSYAHLIPSMLDMTVHTLPHPAWIVRRGGVSAIEWPDYLERLRLVLTI